MKPSLTQSEQLRCVELLDAIVKPGDHTFDSEIREAQSLLGYKVFRMFPRKTRSFYGIHKPKPKRLLQTTQK